MSSAMKPIPRFLRLASAVAGIEEGDLRVLFKELVHVALGGLGSNRAGMNAVHFAKISDNRRRSSNHLAEK